MSGNLDLELLQHCIDARGNIISRVIALESAIDIFLAKYFTESTDKTIDILKLLFSTTRITYGSKVEIFCYIIKKKYPDFKGYEKTYQTDLSNIGEFRNRFAHHSFEIDDEAQAEYKEKGILCLIKYRDEKQPFKINKKELDDWCTKIQFYTKQIATLLK